MSLKEMFTLPLYDTGDVLEQGNLSFEQLDQLKSRLEANLEMLFDHLKAQNADMESSLLTKDGYPRADIDLVQVRFARARIHRDRNDLKRVMVMIERQLHERLGINGGVERMSIGGGENGEYGVNSGVNGANAGVNGSASTSPSIPVSTIPFAVITDVLSESPGSLAGFLVNDKIVTFGDVNLTNLGSNGLARIGALLRDAQERNLNVVVSRNGSLVELTLKPSTNWPGNGLLGCKLNLI